MKNLKLILAVVALFVAPFISKAQGPTEIVKITYSGRVSSPGALGDLRVTTNTGITHDYTTYPSSYDFTLIRNSSGSVTLDFSHGMHPGWGNTYYLVTISNSTLDAQTTGSTVNYYMPNVNRYYQITKAAAPTGTSYAYTLDIKVREPYL